MIGRNRLTNVAAAAWQLFENAWRRKETPISPQDGKLWSSLCTQAALSSESFQAWALRMGEAPLHMHRKIWEYCFIAQAFSERGMLAPGREGLGFAVGKEPLSDLFASFGCNILATDLATESAKGWVRGGQHASSLKDLAMRGICDPEQFRQRIAFRNVDMRELPDDLGQYDFLWSSCSLEHLGGLKMGEKFIYESHRYLRPGGVAVHTTEFNLQSNTMTVAKGPNVIYRERDIRRIAQNLRQRGCRVNLDFTRGDLPYDLRVDREPYNPHAHLTLMQSGYVTTSFGLIIES